MANNLYAINANIEITDSNKFIDFEDSGTVVRAAQIATAVYDNANALRAVIKTAMEAVCGDTYDIFLWFDSTYKCGKFIIEVGSGTFKLLCSTGANQANAAWDILGYDESSDKTGAQDYTAEWQHQYGWYSDHPPALDTYDRPEVTGGEGFLSSSGQWRRITNPNDFDIRRLEFMNVWKEKFHPDHATGSYTNQDYITCWREIARGTPFTLYSETAGYSHSTWVNEGEYALYDPVNKLDNTIAPRLSVEAEYYSFNLDIRKDPT